MAWTIEFERDAENDLSKLSKDASHRIVRFLHDRLGNMDSPRSIGQALKGAKFGNLWKYRVGDYRILVDIQDSKLVVLVVRIGNRRDVYQR